jgi:hypothetical protein
VNPFKDYNKLHSEKENVSGWGEKREEENNRGENIVA